MLICGYIQTIPSKNINNHDVEVYRAKLLCGTKKSSTFGLSNFSLMNKVAIIMGSASDWDVMSPACTTLEEFGIEYEKRVLSAHRNPGPLADYVSKARENGFEIIIAGAGGAAHLPGVIAALTTLPVIGVPVKSKALNGLDSLLSIVQMPSGIPVATMAIDGARNAALYAVSILALRDSGLTSKLEEFRKRQSDKVLNTVI